MTGPLTEKPFDHVRVVEVVPHQADLITAHRFNPYGHNDHALAHGLLYPDTLEGRAAAMAKAQRMLAADKLVAAVSAAIPMIEIAYLPGRKEVLQKLRDAFEAAGGKP